MISFNNFRSNIQKNEAKNEVIISRVKVEKLKWRSVLGVTHNKLKSCRFENKFNKTKLC